MNIYFKKVNDTAALHVTNDTLRSIGGDENFQLFSVKPNGLDTKALTPFPGTRTDIIDGLNDVAGKENELIVGINKRMKEYFDPNLINTETGALTLLV